MASTDNATFQASAPATPPAGFVVRTEEVTIGGTTAHVQVMRLGAAAANSSEIVSSAFPLPVKLQDSTVLVSIQGNTSAVLSTNSTGRVELSSGGMGGVSGNPIWVQPTTTLPVSLTSGSKVQIEPGAGAVFPISGNATAVVANSSGPITTGNPLAVALQNSTATVTIQGNTTAILTTASKVQVEPAAAAVFPISGNSTAVNANSSGVIASGNPLHVFLQDSTATVAIKGNASVSLTTASIVQVEPKAAAVFPISGNTTAVVGNASGAFTTANPLPVLLQSSTATVTVQGNVSAAISGNTTAVNANSSGVITTANPLAVFLQGSTATVTIQGNTTAILTTGSKLQVEPLAGAVFPISGNASVIVTAQPGMAQINTSGGSTIHLMGGMDGNTSNSTARALKVNASQELIITGAVTISGNATVALTTGTTGRVELASGGVGGTSGNALWIQPTTTVPISGNTTAIIGNSSGAFSTANPLAVLLQGSTATVTVQGNVSAAVAGNVSAVISGNATAVLSNTSGNITTANPLAIFLQGSTATVSIQGNATVAGNVTAILTTGSKLQVEPIAAAVFPISGNVSAVVTAIPGGVTLGGAAGTTGLLVYGADTTGSGATVRPLKINASGELVVQTGAIAIGGLAQINTTGGSTMMIVGGMDGGTSNATARALRVNSSGELLTVGGTVSVPGNGVINTTAGTSGLLMLGADGNTSNSTARYLQVNASQELIVKGTIVGNTSVVGNVSAVISGNSTAVLSNTSGNITTANPLAVYLQGSTATVTIAGNSTAVLTSGSISRLDWPAAPVYAAFGAASSSGGLVILGADGTATNSTVRPFRINSSQELLISGAVSVVGNTSVVGNVSAVISGNTTAVNANSSGVITTANPLAIFLQGSTATVTIQGNTSAVISGNTTAVNANSSGVITTANPLAVFLQGSTATVTIQGNSTAILTTGSKVQVEPIAAAVFPISGNTTAILSTASIVRAELTSGGIGGTTANPVYTADAPRLRQFYDGSVLVNAANASINVTASGIFLIVASATGAILVLNAQFSAESSCKIQWMEATTSGLTGVQSVAAGGGFVLPFSPAPWFQTTTGKQLSLSVQGSSAGLGGSLAYARVAS